MAKKDFFFNFKNYVVLLTGSSGQLGNKISQTFLKRGAKVYGIDTVKKNFTKNRKFFFKQGDITDPMFTRKVISDIIKKERKISIIINNASYQVLSDLEGEDKFKNLKFLDTNLIAPINIIKNYILFHKKNANKFCSIINIGSIYGSVSPDFSIYKTNDRFSPEIYGASKAAIIQITKYFSVLLAKKKITVNSISPGGILNKRKQKKDFIKRYKSRVPMGRMANIEDIITAVLMFASDKTKYTTGQNLIIDGGLTSK